MADHASGTEVPRRSAHPPDSADARLLEEAIRKSIATSPEAFLKTIQDVNDRKPDYWQTEIDSATWVVIQKGVDIVGVAVARRPDPVSDTGVSWDDARFVESVWIAPEFRGRHLGERLVRYLFEIECARNPNVRHFLLWVLEKNERAISLYERMGFKYVEEHDLPDFGGRTEFRYEYLQDADDMAMQLAVDERQDDLREDNLIYRVLGRETA